MNNLLNVWRSDFQCFWFFYRNIPLFYFYFFLSPFSAREKGEGLALERSTWPTYNLNLIISISFTALVCSSCSLAEITWFSGARSLFPLFARDTAPQYLSKLRALYHGVGHAVRATLYCMLSKQSASTEFWGGLPLVRSGQLDLLND